jgi:hypothetical protein
MSTEPEDSGQQPPPDEEFEQQQPLTAYTVIKWLAILFLGIPLGLLVVAALVFGVCMLAM